MRINENVKITVEKVIPIDIIYMEYLEKKRKSPFPTVIQIGQAEAQRRVASDAKPKNGVTVVEGEKLTIDQVDAQFIRDVFVIKFAYTGDEGCVFNYEEWDIDNEKNAELKRTKLNLFSQRITRLFAGATGVSDDAVREAMGAANIDKVLGKEATNTADYFEGYAKLFNTYNRGGSIFKNVVVDDKGNIVEQTPKVFTLKLVRQGKGQGANNLQVPVNSAFIEPYLENAPTGLQVLPSDVFKVIEVAQGGPKLAGQPTQNPNPLSNAALPEL